MRKLAILFFKKDKNIKIKNYKRISLHEYIIYLFIFFLEKGLKYDLNLDLSESIIYDILIFNNEKSTQTRVENLIKKILKKLKLHKNWNH